MNLRAGRDPLVGRTIGGRYRLLSRIGSGGMSSVYLARHVLIDRLMAIKTLRRDLAEDPVQRDRFVREARAVNRINHPNIVEITDFGEAEDGLVYLVMEYVPGEPLLTALQSAPLDAMRALDIVEQCGKALARAHQMGVVHRDLKPDNILLLSQNGRADFVKILDFGIAKILDAPSLTGSQQIFGTPGYIAPEYIQSTVIDGRADLYSLGVILYEMVTAALPFDYEYPGDLLVKHVTEPPVRPSARQPGVPAALEALVLRCLAKDPEKRFRDAFHFLDELERTRAQLAGRPASAEDPEDLARTSQDLVAEREISTDPPPPGEVPFGARAGLELAVPDDEGLAIPVAPRDGLLDLSLDAPIAAAHFEDRETLSGEHGLVGVRRWRARHDALRDALASLADAVAIPADLAQRLVEASGRLERLEARVQLAQEHQRAVEALVLRARETRTTFGKSLDVLAGERSKLRGELQALVEQRTELGERLASARQEPARQGEAEALVWELAAVEIQVAAKGEASGTLEAKLAEVRQRLERENEDLEIELSVQTHLLDGEMTQAIDLAGSLREPLDEAERFVRQAWARQAAGSEPSG
jgi:serine/threonine protein kinase